MHVWKELQSFVVATKDHAHIEINNIFFFMVEIIIWRSLAELGKQALFLVLIVGRNTQRLEETWNWHNKPANWSSEEVY